MKKGVPILLVFPLLFVSRAAFGGGEADGAAGFVVTSVTASVSPASYKGGCPKTFSFAATIKADGPCTVTYRWERSDGAKGPTKSVVLPVSGVQKVSNTWTLSSPASSGWQRVHILSPNDIVSNSASFKIECVPFAVTAISASVDPTTYTGPCPKTFTFTGVITANGPGTVTYRWEHSPGTGKVQTVTFGSAGSKTVTLEYPSSKDDFLALVIDGPNPTSASNPLYSLVSFKCTCTPKSD